MEPLSIYLGDLTYTTLSLATDAFPLNVGLIGAYANSAFGSAVNLRLFKYVEDLEQAIAERPPDILGMSNYPWNFSLGLEFFRMVRARSPTTVCVMGGPNIPLDDDSRTEFIRRNPYIDFYAYLEGEEAFAELVRRALDVGPDRVRMKAAPIDGFIHRVDEARGDEGRDADAAEGSGRDPFPVPHGTDGPVLRRETVADAGDEPRMSVLLHLLP